MTFSLYLLRQRSISTTKLQEKQLQEFALLSRRCRRAQLDEKQESNAAVSLCSRLRWRKRSCLRELGLHHRAFDGAIGRFPIGGVKNLEGNASSVPVHGVNALVCFVKKGRGEVLGEEIRR
ncbi:hypothetical protein HPP92_020341 [Vanilla planifolia]|uniref:Uncharacterized protein n=1 Tax=Vanilla planifolia TaxID=51239 RepID=A0A835UJS4_VANPL|nr:hypothetical protein HPP92_020341 [Vanilla planifolia]